MAGIATAQKRINFNELTQTKKGNKGEQIVRQYLESKGWIVYEPITQKAHAFDKLCVKDKKNIVIAEVKTKARMNKWNATGFDLRHYNEYVAIMDKYNIPVFVFFVDEMLKQVYGNKLSVLMQKYQAADGLYPMQITTSGDKTIILFSLEKMIMIDTIKDEDVKILENLSTRKYEYLKVGVV